MPILKAQKIDSQYILGLNVKGKRIKLSQKKRRIYL